LKHFLFVVLIFVFTLSTIAQDVTSEPTSGVTIHVVQRGDTLWGLARAYGVSVDELAQLNSISNTSGLEVGQRLLVPSETAPITNTNPDGNVVINQPSETLHTVANGETLYRIAVSYGLTVNDLIQANNILNASVIYAGQQLIIPSSSQATIQTTLTLPTPLTNIVLSPRSFVEGKTGSIVINASAPITITGDFLNSALNFISDNNGNYFTMVGVPIFTEAGNYPVNLNINGTPFTFNIQVLNGGYLTTNITLSPEQEALLAPAVEEFEIGTIRNITSQFTPDRLFDGVFGLPAAAAMNAPYGTRRSYNGGPVSRYHNGADFATPPGSPIYATASGRVVLADLLNIRGNTVVIQHGWGIYSLYAHLTSLNVNLGDTVEIGQVIGLSGSTGRVTGPHLHWEVWVNGIAVDPIEWTQRTFP
jgi:murein DD-endopeptidase MepM/ murein hydrolase activator NlpD